MRLCVFCKDFILWTFQILVVYIAVIMYCGKNHIIKWIFLFSIHFMLGFANQRHTKIAKVQQQQRLQAVRQADGLMNAIYALSIRSSIFLYNIHTIHGGYVQRIVLFMWFDFVCDGILLRNGALIIFLFLSAFISL